VVLAVPAQTAREELTALVSAHPRLVSARLPDKGTNSARTADERGHPRVLCRTPSRSPFVSGRTWPARSPSRHFARLPSWRCRTSCPPFSAAGVPQPITSCLPEHRRWRAANSPGLIQNHLAGSRVCIGGRLRPLAKHQLRCLSPAGSRDGQARETMWADPRLRRPCGHGRPGGDFGSVPAVSRTGGSASTSPASTTSRSQGGAHCQTRGRVTCSILPLTLNWRRSLAKGVEMPITEVVARCITPAGSQSATRPPPRRC